MEKRDRVLILGGGLAGITAAYRLAQAGREVIVVEKAEEVGGLATSRVIETEWGEFSFDTGPHRFFSQDEEINEETLKQLGDNVVEADRLSRIFLYGKFFDYPLKLGKALLQLPKSVMAVAIANYFTQSIKNLFIRSEEKNFEDWVIRRFGRKLFEVFFGVYTEKTWGVPCTEISKDWAAQRINQTSLLDAVKKSLFRPKDVRQLSTTFFYPKHGGIGELSLGYKKSAIGYGADVRLNTTVEAVTHENGRVTGARVKGPDGAVEHIAATTVLNTIPVNGLVRMLEPAPPAEVLENVEMMKHRSMVFVFVILDRPKLTDDHWIYIPEASLTVHRLSEFKNFSPHAAPPDKTLICAEITCDYGDDDWNRPDDELRELAVADLVNIGLIEAKEVLHTFPWRERYAYPLYTIGYEKHMRAVLDHVDSVAGLDTTGRQGLFKYNNMDHSVAMGLGAARTMLGNEERHRDVASEQEYFG